MRLSSAFGTLGLVLIFGICQVFFVVLLISGLNKYYQDNQKDLISMNMEATAYHLSVITSLRQNIQNYQGSFDDLYHLKLNTNTQDAFIISPQGKILVGQSALLSEEELASFVLPENLKDISEWEINGKEFFLAPLVNNEQAVAFVVAAQSVSPYLEAQNQERSKRIYQDAIFGSIASLLILGIALFFVPKIIKRFYQHQDQTAQGPDNAHIQLKLRKPSKSAKTLMIPFVLAQLIFLGWLMPSISSQVYQQNNNAVQTASAVVVSSFQHVAKLGINIEQISDIDPFLEKFKARMSNIGGISVLSANKQLIAGDQLENNALYQRDVPLFNNVNLLGTIVIWADFLEVLIQIGKLALTILTFLVISCLVVFELSVIVFCEKNRLQQQAKPSQTPLNLQGSSLNVATGTVGKFPYELEIFRPISFLCSCVMFTTLSIVPIVMSTFAQDFDFLSKTVLMSLPVTVQMIAIGLSSLMIFFISKRVTITFKNTLLCGLGLVAIGMMCGFLAFNGWMFLLAQALFGVGYGSSIVGLQLLVVACTATEQRGAGMSSFVAGLYVGILCSCAAGGLIADHISPRFVFLATSITAIGSTACILWLMKNRNSIKELEDASSEKLQNHSEQNATEQHAKEHNLAEQKQVAKSEQTKGGTAQSTQDTDNAATTNQNKATLFEFLMDPKVICTFLLQVMPCSMITIGFFNFFLPVFCNENNLGATSVGQFNFIYTLIIIVFSPVVGRMLDRSKHGFLFLGVGLTCASFVPSLFGLDNIIVALISGMVMLGVAMSINESSQPAVVSKFEITERYGSDNAVMIFDMSLRVGQMLGPTLVALLLSYFGSSAFKYVNIVGLILAVCYVTLMFGFSRNTDKPESNNISTGTN